MHPNAFTKQDASTVHSSVYGCLHSFYGCTIFEYIDGPHFIDLSPINTGGFPFIIIVNTAALSTHQEEFSWTCTLNVDTQARISGSVKL